MDIEKRDLPLVAGVVRFDPRDWRVKGKLVREIRLRPLGGGEDEVVWVWPEYAHVPLAQGDLVAVQGRRRAWWREDVDGRVREFVRLSAQMLFRLAPERPLPGV